jgi:hypothetical protein
MSEFKLSYENARKDVVIEDWPNGRTQKVKAVFSVETGPKGERAVRVTTGKLKKLTYARKVRYVDGSDGRLYILEIGHYNNAITVMRGTFDYQQEYITADDYRHAGLWEMFTEPSSVKLDSRD